MSALAEVSIANARLPQTYEAAKTALANCAQVDECKEWSDKAQALASYAKMADDDSLLKLSRRIAGRAVRRCGELLSEFNQQGKRSDKPFAGDHGKSQADVAREAGLSEHQELQAVRVANVPEADFESQIESDNPPTVTALAEQGKRPRPKPTMPEPPPHYADATEVIGGLRHLNGLCERLNARHIAQAIEQHERGEIVGFLTNIEVWCDLFRNELED